MAKGEGGGGKPPSCPHCRCNPANTLTVGTNANPEGLYPETLQLLLQSPSGPRLDAVDTNFGRTTAHWAVFYKRHDLLLQLMMAGTVYLEVSVIVLPVLKMQSSHGGYFYDFHLTSYYIFSLISIKVLI